MMFYNFLNFFTIFSEFSKPSCVGIDLERKFFFLRFFGFSHPSLARNKPKMMFYNILNFYTILVFPVLVWLEINPE